MEFLKETLGESLYAQVQEKLSSQDNIKLANLATGDYVGKQKFLNTEQKAKNLQNQLESLQTQMTDLQKKSETVANLQKKMKSFAIDKALIMAGARNLNAVKGLLNQETLIFEKDNLSGLSEQLSALKTTDAYLFSEEPSPKTHGGNPADQKTFTDYDSMTDEELFEARKKGIT